MCKVPEGGRKLENSGENRNEGKHQRRNVEGGPTREDTYREQGPRLVLTLKIHSEKRGKDLREGGRAFKTLKTKKNEKKEDKKKIDKGFYQGGSNVKKKAAAL